MSLERPGWLAGRSVLVAVCGVIAALLVLVVVSLPAGGSSPLRRAGMLQSRLGGLSISEQAVISSRLGAADPSYRARATSAGGYRLTGGGVAAKLSRGGVSVRTGNASLSLSALALGHGGRLTPLTGAAVSARGNRVDLARTGLWEAYAAGPLGIEQSFMVPRRPIGMSGPLTLSLGMRGARPSWLTRGSVVTFGGVFRYGGLSVVDARGVHLRSWLELSGRRVLIRAADAGAVYPLRIDPFVQVAKLTASDGAAQDDFGTSIAVSGSTVAVGASNASVGPTHQGAVYVFTQPAGGWADETQAAKLTASDGAAGDGLGQSVATDGSTVVAGTTGAVYVFTKPSGGWANETEAAKLTELHPGVHDGLGSSGVGLSGNTVVAGDAGATVGANGGQGAVYVFDNDGAGWSGLTHESAILSASDGAADDHLGRSVAMSGGTVVAGSDAKIGSNSGQGAAYVFTKPAGGWSGQQTEAAKLTASDGAQNDFLGGSVAIDGGTVIAGSQHGAYVFTQPIGGWSGPRTEAEKLSNSDGAFIESVGISGTTAVAGTAGKVYVYSEPSGGWSGSHVEDQQLTASDNADNGTLGRSVAIDGTTVAAGAYLASVNRVNSGAAYVFKGGTPPLARTGGVADVTDTSASLLALVNPTGSPTTYYFQYGRTTAYGSTTATHDAGQGTDDDVEAADVTGLPPSTTFHYRVVATNTGGTTFGADRSFTTADFPAIVASTDPPTSLGSTTATLAGTINPEGRTVTYHFQYGSTAAYGATTPDQTVGPDSDSHAVAADIANLQPSSTYHYRLVVGNGQAVGADRQLTTTAAQFGAPSVALVGKPVQVDGQGEPLGSISTAGKATFDIQVTSDTPGTVVVQLQLADGTGSTVTSDPVNFSAGTSIVNAQMGIGAQPDGTFGPLMGRRAYVAQALATTQAGAIGSSLSEQFTTGTGPLAPACEEGGIGGPGQQGQVHLDTGCGQKSVHVTSVTATTADLTWLARGAKESAESFAAQLEYGLTKAYGRAVSATISSDAVTVHIDQLAPGTLYHARLDASDFDGVTAGSDFVFVTSTLAQPPSTGSLNISIGAATVDLPCQSTAGCQGSVTLYSGQAPSGLGKLVAGISRARSVKLGTTKFKIPGHRRTPVHIRLNATGKRLARGHKSLVVTEVITTISHGHAATIVHRLTLRTRH